VIPYHRSHPAFDLDILLATKTGVKLAHVPLNDVLPFNVPMIGRVGDPPLELSQLADLVVKTRTAIRTRDDTSAKESLQVLYSVLIQPLLDQGVRLQDYDHLIVVPHAVLHYVPFPALRDPNGSYLISKTAITVVPSASVWLTLAKRTGPVERFVGFGNPDLRGAYPDLPAAAEEVATISKLMSVASPLALTGSDATPDRLFQEAPSANILHIATHGDFPDENALDLHAVFLAKGKKPATAPCAPPASARSTCPPTGSRS
jgi:CHAT domain-containing protein